ncbi:hypothetical protein [Thiolapillus sp.]
MKNKLLPILGSLLLMSLGVMLYYSSTPYMNLYVAPMVKSLGFEPTRLVLAVMLGLIAFTGALIAGFFSVFLFEMVSGGYRPLFMGVLYATPIVVIHLSLVIMGYVNGANMPLDVLWLYLGEVVAIYLGFLLTARAGQGVARRFFMPEAPAS